MIEYFKYLTPEEKWRAYSFAVNSGDYRDSQGIAGFTKAFDCSTFETESGEIVECVYWKHDNPPLRRFNEDNKY
jgi:hypothetical protein